MGAAKEQEDDLDEILKKANLRADRRGWSPLHVAAYEGHLSIVQRLLQHEDTVVDLKGSYGGTALGLASERGHFQVCQCLLQNGANPNEQNESPLHIALKNRHLDCARLLVEYGADVNAVHREGRSFRTPMLEAAQLGLTTMVALLIESGADVDVDDGTGITPLFEAAWSGNLQCVRLIHQWRCKNGNANVDVETVYGMTPLMIAAYKGRLDCVRYLMGMGADVNRAANDGALALHQATWKRHLGCVQVLLPRTSRYSLLKACYGNQVTEDPNWLRDFMDGIRGNGAFQLPDRGVSVLHIAVDLQAVEILYHLLEGGIHPDHYICKIRQHELTIVRSCNYFNDSRTLLAETAVGLACRKFSVPMVAALLDNGAQLTLGNDLICDPLHSALNIGCPTDFIRFLVRRGADINSHPKKYQLCRSKSNPYERHKLVWQVKVDNVDVPPVVTYAFRHPYLLREVLLLGGRLKNWDPEVSGGVGHLLVEMARRQMTGDGLLKVLSVVVHFAPRHQFRPLYSTLKSICEAKPHVSLVEWTALDQIVASQDSLLELCRLKTREVLMMRRGFNLESDVSTLPLPSILREYLMFH